MQNSNWRFRPSSSPSEASSPPQPPPTAVSPAPPAALVEESASAAAEASLSTDQSCVKEGKKVGQSLKSSGRASGVDEMQRRVKRALCQEGRGGWGAATPEKKHVREIGTLQSPLNPSSPSFSPRSTNAGTTPRTRSALAIQFGEISTTDPLFDMANTGVWKASPAHPSPRQTQPLTSSLSSLRLAHHALQAQLTAASTELLLLQTDSQEQAWLASRLSRAEEQNAEFQLENDGLRRELGKLGRHKEGMDELLGVRSPPESPFAGRGVRSNGLVRGASNESAEVDGDHRSTTPQPSTSTAPLAPTSLLPLPLPLPLPLSSADPRSLILNGLLQELRGANATIRDLHNSLTRKEATIQELGEELVETREEKVKLLVQLFEGSA